MALIRTYSQDAILFRDGKNHLSNVFLHAFLCGNPILRPRWLGRLSGKTSYELGWNVKVITMVGV